MIAKAFQKFDRLEWLDFKSLGKFLYQLRGAYFLTADQVLQASETAPTSE